MNNPLTPEEIAILRQLAQQQQEMQQQLNGIRHFLSQSGPAPATVSSPRRQRGGRLSTLATLAMLLVLAFIVIDVWPQGNSTLTSLSAAPLPDWAQQLPLPTALPSLEQLEETAISLIEESGGGQTAVLGGSSTQPATTSPDPHYQPAYTQDGITYYMEATPQGDEALFVLEDGVYNLYAYQGFDGSVYFEENDVVYEMAADGTVSPSHTSSEALQAWYAAASPAQQQELHAPVPTPTPQPTPNPTVVEHNANMLATPAASGRRGGGSVCAGLSRSACMNQMRGTPAP